MFETIKKIFTFKISNYKFNYGKLNPMNYNWRMIKRILKVFVIFMAGVALTVLTYQLVVTQSDDEMSENIASKVIEYLDDNYFTPDDVQSGCNLKVITFSGELVTYVPPEDLSDNGNLMIDETSSEHIMSEINDAESKENYKAIVLEIDSLGGYAVAADEVASAMKKAKKPNAALIRKYGTSAAYYSATGADIIFANKNSDVGGIGVTYSYIDNAKKNQKDGLTYNQISTGKFKDTGDPDKPLTEEEKNLLLSDARAVNENFIRTVAENRKLDINKVRKIADGSSMIGENALKNGLIDRIGGIDEVVKYLEEKTGEKLVVCK